MKLIPKEFKNFAVSVFGIDSSLDNMTASLKGIEALEKFFFEDLKLTKTLTELNIDRTHFDIMAEKACGNGVLKGFKELKKEDIKIFMKCVCKDN